MKAKISKLIKEKAIITFLVGALIGVISFLLQYGIDVVRFTNTEWLTHSNNLEGLWDLTQHYYGWVLYRNTPWTFPIGLLEGVACTPISVAYTDSIPLFAIFFKILSPILPASFQYFGLYELMTYALMGGLGSLITYKFSRNLMSNSISAMFFVMSPVLLKRTFYHSALSGHFVILAAICLWIYRDEISKKKYIVYWSILTVISTLINPYYVPMVIGILACSVVQDLIVNKKWIYSILSVLIPGVASLFIGWIIGLFYGEVSSTGRGIDKVSFNLNQLVNPYNPLLSHEDYHFDDMSYSSIMPKMELSTPWQSEGFSYLGLGMIVLCVFVLVLWIISLFRGKEKFADKEYKKTYISYIIGIAIGVLVFTLLALGPVACIGSHQIYSIDWPESIYNLFAMFRTAGRFIWPVYYGIMALTMIGLMRLLKGNMLCTIVLFVALAIQIIDLWPSFVYKHSVYQKAEVGYESNYRNEICDSPMWQYLADKTDEIIFATPTETSICFLAKWSCTFETYAVNNGINMSASYCSRDVSAVADRYANDNYEQRRQGERFPNKVYVLLWPDMLDQLDGTGLNIYQISNYYVASDLDLSMFEEAHPIVK
ncbi:MAG: DUF6311 domain-containing protein [Lachnospiraceae bacterium]|nr:DUF6311 domain-containing protein [Lachnospiraceae bacterium]